MVNSRYNTGANHIKSSQVLLALGYPFSTRERGADTMSHSISNPSEQSNIPYGYCQCGCGQLAPIAKQHFKQRGWIKGQPIRFIAGHNMVTMPKPADGFKYCSRCRTEKSHSEFRPRPGRGDGLQTYCNKCVREYKRVYKQRNQERVTRLNREYIAKNRSRLNMLTRESMNRHPVAVSARSAISSAVTKGKFPPAWTMVCEHCQEAQASHWHHHKGYESEYKLDVIALCVECHGKEHRVQA